jgi:hypothetical protein
MKNLPVLSGILVNSNWNVTLGIYNATIVTFYGDNVDPLTPKFGNDSGGGHGDFFDMIMPQ